MADTPSSAKEQLAPTQYEKITDGQADIAMNMDGVQMKVELVGRQPLQKIWLWLGSNEKAEGKKKTSSSQTTNKPYKPEHDGPAVAGQPPALPTKEELVPHEVAVEYLEVGLVFGDDPQKLKKTASTDSTASGSTPTSGAPKAASKKVKPKAPTSTLTRDPTCLRAFIPVTEYVADQAKYYVGCRPVQGRCYPRVVDGDCVFFYAEFWQGLPEKSNKLQRRDHVNTKTKQHAAVNKTAIDRSTAAITFTEAEKRTTSNPLAVTQAENVASLLVLQSTVYLETGNRDFLKGMLAVIEDAAPDLKAGPYSANRGTLAFYDLDTELSEDDARQVKQELKVAIPDLPDLNVVQIQLVHRILRENAWADRLPLHNLAIFLECCHDAGALQDFDQEVAKQAVERALQTVKLHNKYQSSQYTLPDEMIDKDSYNLVLKAILGVVQSVCDYIQDSNKALAEQHGGVLKHGGIKDLMNKLGNAIDVASQQTFWEQLSVLHAVQHASTNRKASEKLEELQKLIVAVLKARGVENGGLTAASS